MKIEIKNVTKKYASGKVGLSNFSMTIENGVLGLLGANGAGKSTLLNLISTMHTVTTGKIFLNQNDVTKKPNEIRKILGYLPQSFGFYSELNTYEFLEYIAALRGVDRKSVPDKINELLELLNLTDVASKPLHSYSGGMKQRVGIASALINNPKILLLDEPSVGLDPEERSRFNNLISELSKDRIVILSSHIISDIESVSDTVAILKEGLLLIHDQKNNLMGKVNQKIFESVISDQQHFDLIRKNQLIHSLKTIDGYKARYLSNHKMPQQNEVIPTLADAFVYFNKGLVHA